MVFPANLLRDISKIKPSFDNMKASTNQKNYSKHYKKSSGLHYATVRATQDYNCLHTTQHCKEVNIQNRKKPHTFFPTNAITSLFIWRHWLKIWLTISIVSCVFCITITTPNYLLTTENLDALGRWSFHSCWMHSISSKQTFNKKLSLLLWLISCRKMSTFAQKF